ncbi:MAG TPA: hypothetical protein VKB48_09220 [Candidatus Acidoferrum sp.]|nr:hypothetical protein [Candidatus Acidoferrum sp.]
MFEPLSVSIRRWLLRFLVSGGAAFVAAALVCGQQPAGAGGSSSDSSKPDSPKPKQEASATNKGGSRFIGYATSGSIIFPDIATSPFPLSPGGKFKVFVNQSISPAYLFASALSAAKNQATNSPSAPGQGWDAYGTRYGYSIARASSQAFFGNFVFASILRQDPRFFPESHPSFGRAIKYSVKRLFVTRSDNGNDVFNASAFLGPLAAEALSNAYYPVHEQTGARTMQRYASDIGWHLAGNMFKEYWPTVFRDVHLKALKVIPDPNH